MILLLRCESSNIFR